MLVQTSLKIEKPSLPPQVETDQAALSQDLASRRSSRFLWTGFGFAVLMLIGFPARVFPSPASHASAKPSHLLPEVAFNPSLPAIGPGGIRQAKHTGRNRAGPVLGSGTSPRTTMMALRYFADGTTPREILELQKINVDEETVPLTLSDITANYEDRAALIHPAYLTGEIQLEELEADTSTITAINLLADGNVEFGATDGPLPSNNHGEWASDGNAFFLVWTRTFDVSKSVFSAPDLTGMTYKVTRAFEGTVDTHSSTGYTTAEGTLRVGDLPAGYFKLLVLPKDIDELDSELEKRVKAAEEAAPANAGPAAGSSTSKIKNDNPDDYATYLAKRTAAHNLQ